MNIGNRAQYFAISTLVLILAGCDGGGDTSPPDAPPVPPLPPPPGTLIGADGGTVTGPNGAEVVIPANALTAEVRISIEEIAPGEPELPDGFTAHGPTFAFTPHGTTFALPVTMTLPFDPAGMPTGSTPAFFKTTNAQTEWEEIGDATFGATSVSAEVTSFSNATVVIPPLTRTLSANAWAFSEFRGDALEEVFLADGGELGEDMHELFDFGPAHFDSGILHDDGEIEPDNIASGDVAATADGVTYWVGAEAPIGNAAIPEDPIGSKAFLMQFQTYIKNAADASYRFTLSQAFVQVWDGNGSLSRPCPSNHDLIGDVCDLVKGRVELSVKAYLREPERPPFYVVSGGAQVRGWAGAWLPHVWTDSGSRVSLWTILDDFSVDREDFNGPDGHVTLELIGPRTYTVDLSSVGVGKKFTVFVTASASTYNRAAGTVSGQDAEFETAANAWLRDPLAIGGTTVTTTGLTPVATPLPLEEPVEAPVAPAPCVPGPGPDPAAGVIQFGAETFTQAEASSTSEIAVTRTGGTVGEATATFSTSDGTALAGGDYTAVNSTVFFADGDAAVRFVEVPIIQDLLNDEPDKTVNLLLSEPGGCVALGSQTNAVLTIRDDDTPTPPTLFTVGGTVTGLTGTGLVLENHTGLFLEIEGNGPFTFSNLPSPSGTPYFVRVFNQPLGPGGVRTQECTVTNGSGVFSNENVTDVVVTCEDL